MRSTEAAVLLLVRVIDSVGPLKRVRTVITEKSPKLQVSCCRGLPSWLGSKLTRVLLASVIISSLASRSSLYILA